jgi:NADH-ubiquinone oxidoreductase chain 4
MALVILGWGPQPERVNAVISMVVYTLVWSAPFLLLICWRGSMAIGEVPILQLGSAGAIIVMRLFIVKLPVYLLHAWLPKAHVEAPAAGRMFLASILLKLGAYGIVRFRSYNAILLSLTSLVGGLFARILVLAIVDLKIIVAFSSILHIGPCA